MHAPLPIDPLLPDLIEALRSSPAVVLQAPPGAGKTTRVPPTLLDSDLIPTGQILMLQPRRVAARAAASRIAAERGEKVGASVGYRIRFEARDSKQTRILVLTEGILTRRLISDPVLEGVACVILDEFHERSVHTDLALAFLKELLEVRNDLKLVLMSATLDAKPLSRFLGECPVLTCVDRAHELTVEYVDQLDRRRLEDRVATGLRMLLTREDDDGGDVLVFLPGAPEIERTRKRVAQAGLPGDPEVLPLYGALPHQAQDRALQPGQRRRVVLATNIAETSLTIPGVTAVLDSGLRKLMRHDTRIGMDRLETVSISQASATQRAGRAGRTAPGRALRLWTRGEHAGLPLDDQPEILRIDLAPVLLQVLGFHPGDPAEFDFFETPARAAIQAGLDLLRLLGAVERDGYALTERGTRLASLPLHPRVGCLLERAAEVGLLDQGALLAALLGEGEILKSLARASLPTSDSDLLYRAELLETGQADLNPAAVRRVERAREQILRTASRLWPEPASAPKDPEAELSRLLLAGYPDRVCRRREPHSVQALMVGGRGVALSDESGVRQAELFVALQADAGKRGTHSVSRVRLAHGIEGDDLKAVHPDLLRTREGAMFDPERGSVVGMRQTLFADLVLEQIEGVDVPAEVKAERLVEEAALRFDTIFKPGKEASALLERLRFATHVLPEEGWPGVSDEAIRGWLPDLCVGRHSLAELEKLDWQAEIQARLDHKLARLLDVEIPERVAVPSGSKIRIEYGPALQPEGAPVLAVQLQQVFGLADTPRIARGRVALVLHLLAPNQRPAQVTQDLKSFWENTYPEVRKELRARYPKHAWPEDPWKARPESRPKRKKRK